MKYYIDTALQTFAFEDADTEEFIAQYAQPDWTPISNIPVEPPKPEFDKLTQVIVLDGCEMVNGKWQYRWRVDALSTEQIESKRRAAVPTAASPRQIRQALTKVNLRTQVEQAISSSDQDTKDWWEFATLFERNHPKVILMGTALGQTELQMDELFTLAGSL